MKSNNEEKIQPLSEWLNKVSDDIKNIPFKKEKELLISKVNHQYISKMQCILSQRKSFFEYYQNIVNADDRFFRKPITIDSEESFHSHWKLGEDDIPDTEKTWIKIHKKHYTYSDTRHQCLISLLVLNSQIYEKCIETLFIIDSPSTDNIPFGYPSILLSKNINTNKYKNLLQNNQYQAILQPSRQKYGCYLGFMSKLRNGVIHRNNLISNSKNIFVSNTGIDKDQVDDTFITKIYNTALQEYQLSDPLMFHHFLKNSKQLNLIISECIEKSDHYLGSLIYKILEQREILMACKQQNTLSQEI